MFNATIRVGGIPDGPDFTTISTDLDTISLLIKSDLQNIDAKVTFELTPQNELCIYVTSVCDNMEQKPFAYMRGYNSLCFPLKK